MKTKVILLFQTVLFLFLLWSCGNQKDEPTATPNLSALKGNPALNRWVFANKGGELYKLNVTTGNQEAVFKFKNVNVSSLDYVDEVLYVGAMDNSMNAISLSSMSLLWDIPLIEYEETVLAQPDVVVKDGIAYAVGTTGVLIAFDIKAKKLVWGTALHPGGYTDERYHKVITPTISGDKLVIGTNFSDRPNYVHVLDKNTGKSIWTREMAADEYASGRIKVAGNLLLISSSKLLAWDLTTGKTQWEFQPSADHYSTGVPVVKGDRVFLQAAAGLASGKLFCLNLQTGQKLWEQDAGITYAASYTPCVVDQYVLGVEEFGSSFGTYSGLLGHPFVADATTGKILWKNDKLWVQTSPIYANGHLFFYGYNPELPGTIDDQAGVLCLEASTGKFVWINPYFGNGDHISPMVIADNGVFRTGDYME